MLELVTPYSLSHQDALALIVDLEAQRLGASIGLLLHTVAVFDELVQGGPRSSLLNQEILDAVRKLPALVATEPLPPCSAFFLQKASPNYSMSLPSRKDSNLP